MAAKEEALELKAFYLNRLSRLQGAAGEEGM
jgi:hypothetical protein